MDVAQVEQRLAALRADEDRAREQLADVSEKLGLWLEGVRAAQAALLERARLAGLTVNAPPRPAHDEESAEGPDGPEEPAEYEPLDDEALLDSLDPEVANAIRVKRRLAPNKSVRDLLEEIQVSRPLGEGGKSKRWWRRRNE